ncbi:MAG: hypothetical protein ETSY1_41985 [Candidatus Entotheonella factor]|uniref:Uncharacterized protein n=1 Tax=Entotheonella factor TaxID=1429438 RepID=W4L4M9_ENTF1|nr:hypothetical protein [Candidatus Entotheonella palauensis]ETW92819.1 MAG: hypothetical protein ETSY1_41985 [Candidatus Entotheonella factor]
MPRHEISAASGLLNITRQIAGMGGIALAGVLLERWHYTHHVTGAAHLAAVPVELEQVQGKLAWLLHGGGEVGDAISAKTQAALSQYLNQESLSLAFQDCFVVFAMVFIAAAIAGLCIPGGKPNYSHFKWEFVLEPLEAVRITGYLSNRSCKR